MSDKKNKEDEHTIAKASLRFVIGRVISYMIVFYVGAYFSDYFAWLMP